MPRLEPLDPPYADEIEDTLRRLMGPAEQEPLKLFRTIAHHDVLLDRFRQLGTSLLAFGRLPARDREIIIHRTTARCGASYEWGVHAALFAELVGLDPGPTWSDDTAADADDDALFRAVDELHDAATWTDETFGALRERYSDDQLVELVVLVGQYHLVSYVSNAFGVDAEPWAVEPPE